jgi:DNA-binding HxlR family transcriptional regulator
LQEQFEKYSYTKMESMPEIDRVIALCRTRWLVPILAQMAEGGGARFVVLANRLKAPRDSLTRALAEAQASGWIMRIPGHGHPLRPEYILTSAGRDAAVLAVILRDWLKTRDLAHADLTRWGLPILRLLSDGPSRFNALGRALAPATPRALTIALDALVAQGLVKRHVLDKRPPATCYQLADAGSPWRV